MKVDQLKRILLEYPMSLRLSIVVERCNALETTVVEMILKLGDLPQDALLTFCGLSSCILRERVEEPKLNPSGTLILGKRWLEMDMR